MQDLENGLRQVQIPLSLAASAAASASMQQQHTTTTLFGGGQHHQCHQRQYQQQRFAGQDGAVQGGVAVLCYMEARCMDTLHRACISLRRDMRGYWMAVERLSPQG